MSQSMTFLFRHFIQLNCDCSLTPYANLLESLLADAELKFEPNPETTSFSEGRRVEELMKMMLRLLVRFAELSPVMIVLHLQV